MPKANLVISSQNPGDARRVLARASSKPDLQALRADLASSLMMAGAVQGRQNVAAMIRLQEWEGQSIDFRKHAEDLGEDALPFEGAADTRPLIADAIVNERVALMVEALMSGEMQVVPGGLDDMDSAKGLTRLLHYLRHVLLARELRSEAKLLANYQEGDDPGVGILKVWWRREPALEMRTLSMEDVMQQLLGARGLSMPEDGQEPGPSLFGAIDDLTDMLFSPLRKDEALETLGLAFPTVAPKLLRKALRGLQRDGETDLPLPFVKENRPAVTALRYMQDVVFPADVDDIQKCRSVHEYERLSEVELRAKGVSEGWDEASIEEVIEAGPGPSEAWSYQRYRNYQWIAGEREIDNLYEVIHSYTRSADDYGVPGVYLTTWSAKVQGSYLAHALLDYPDGEYPFVLFRAEQIGRGVFMSRGVPHIAGAAQHEIKVQRDCRADYTQISTLPPVKVKQRRGALELLLGPMVEVSVRDQDDVAWMEPPPFPQMSIQVEQAARADLNEYFGRLVADVPPELRQALLQDKVNSWTDAWVTAWTKMTQLMQAFMDAMDIQLATGAPMETLTRDEIRGRFHLLLKFAVADLNMEFVTKRLDAIGTVLPWDIQGDINRSALIRLAFRGIDPALATMGVVGDGSASLSEQKDEVNAVALMAQGINPPLQQSGVNAGLRLQTMTQTLQGSPTLMRRLMAPQTQDDQLFAQLVQERQKNLSFLQQQVTTNAQAGRTGVKPVLPPAA